MNTGGPAFPAPEVGVQLHDYNGNVSGCRVFTPSQGMTLLDWMAGQALAGLCASPETQMPFDVMHRLAYGHAEAMLDEKARREADHSPDAGKMVEINRELVEALGAIVLRAEDPALCDDTDALLIKARAALAKAKGGA